MIPPAPFLSFAASDNRPTLSNDPSWVPAMLMVIACIFLAALIVGPIVRRRLGRTFPPTHSHDEPPGATGHHGPSGQIDPRTSIH